MTDTLYRLRGLEWVSNNGAMWAFTPAGKYVIRLMLGGPRKWKWRWQIWGGPANYADSLSAAQSASEAHYRARMAEGLVEVPPCECCGAVLGLFTDCQGVPLCKECFDSLDPDDCDCPKHRKEPTQ